MERAIINSLLRIEGIGGELPSPFERPQPEMDFWVLELPAQKDSVGKWSSRIRRILKAHSAVLQSVRRRGGLLTLFIETAGRPQPLVLETGFLKFLSGLGISAENFQR